MAASEYSARMTRLRAMAHRLCGAGDSDMHKQVWERGMTGRLMLLSLLANESPYNTTPVTHPTTGELLVPQQEVLRTLQDWLWHKLLVVHRPCKGCLSPSEHAAAARPRRRPRRLQAGGAAAAHRGVRLRVLRPHRRRPLQLRADAAGGAALRHGGAVPAAAPLAGVGGGAVRCPRALRSAARLRRPVRDDAAASASARHAEAGDLRASGSVCRRCHREEGPAGRRSGVGRARRCFW